MSKNISSRRVRASLAGLSVLGLGLAGCSGGGSGGGRNDGGDNSALPNVVVTALTSNNRLSVFSARRPDNVQQVTLTGLRTDEQLIGIDVRYPNTMFTGTSLYALGSLNGSYQLYQLAQNGDTSAVATPVGVPFTLSPALGIGGFDFNPAADRIRVVDAATQRNFRINPNTGAIVDSDTTTAGLQLDGTLTYDASDANTGSTPALVGAAYNNNDAIDTTGTVNYAIDRTRGTLVTQGDNGDGAGADTGVSPNTGRLFTVGALSVPPGTGDLGFDITPAGTDANRGLVALAPAGGGRIRLYEISLATGALTGGAFVNVPATNGVLDIAVTSPGTVVTTNKS